MNKINVFIGVTFLMSVLNIRTLSAQWGGQLDESFGNGGKVMLYFNDFGSVASAMHLQPDGSILLAGTSQGSYTFVAKLLEDGASDNSFGTGGVVEHLFGCYYTVCNDITVQSDGKFLVIGTLMETDTSVYERLFMARINSDGSIDGGFANNGIYIHNDSLGSTGQFIGLLPNGKILAGGYAGVGIEQGNSIHEYLLLRFNSNGTPDTDFNGTGETIADFDTLSDIASGMAIQPDGKIILAGNSYNYSYTASYMCLVRFNTDGTPDTGFGVNGKVLYNPSLPNSWLDMFLDVALQPDGKIVCCGSATSIAAFMRFNADGSPDTGFGTNGLTTYYYENSYTEARTLTFQNDGKILWGGYTDYGPAQAVMITGRLNCDGTIDNTWGSNQNGGQITYVTGQTTSCSINNICLQPNGRLLVCGYGANTLLTGYAAAARFFTGDNTGLYESPDIKRGICYPSPALQGQEFIITMPQTAKFKNAEAYDVQGRHLTIELKKQNANSYLCRIPNTQGLCLIRLTTSAGVFWVKQMIY